MAKRRNRSSLATAALTAALLAACTQANIPPDSQPEEPIGVQRTPPEQRQPAPAISGPTLEEEPLSLADFRGKTVVLNLWASWCAPCRQELPVLAQAARNAGPRVQFLGLNVKDSRGRALAMQEKYGVDYPSIFDENGRWFGQFPYLPRALPNTIVIDGQGKVRATVIGPVTEQDLEDLLGQD